MQGVFPPSQKLNKHTCIHKYMYTNIHTCMYTYMHIYKHTCIHKYRYTNIPKSRLNTQLIKNADQIQARKSAQNAGKNSLTKAIPGGENVFNGILCKETAKFLTIARKNAGKNAKNAPL